MLDKFGIKSVLDYKVLDYYSGDVLYHCNDATENKIKIELDKVVIKSKALLDLNLFLLINKNNYVEENNDFKKVNLEFNKNNKTKRVSIICNVEMLDFDTGIVFRTEIYGKSAYIKPILEIPFYHHTSTEIEFEFEILDSASFKIIK